MKLFNRKEKDVLPLNHWRHLNRLAQLRRCKIDEALAFMIGRVEPVEENWIDARWTGVEGERKIDLQGHDKEAVIKLIQGLPRNIRPVTDGHYLEEFKFFSDQDGLLGIEADGLRIQDFRMVSARERQVFPLVSDLLPEMSLEEFRVYNNFNSQYLRLTREPHLFTMPQTEGQRSTRAATSATRPSPCRSS